MAFRDGGLIQSVRMSILGTRVVRKEDPKFLTAGATYTADVQDEALEGAAFVTYVRSMMAHASITGIDVTDAKASPKAPRKRCSKRSGSTRTATR